MNRYRAINFLGILSCSSVLASPVMAECTVPNAIANGEVADASKVMDNFSAVAACADDGVKPTGTTY